MRVRVMKCTARTKDDVELLESRTHTIIFHVERVAKEAKVERDGRIGWICRMCKIGRVERAARAARVAMVELVATQRAQAKSHFHRHRPHHHLRRHIHH